MRLRLCVRRHALPPVEILWTISDEQAQKALTISQLLEEVNHIIPLEAEHWGLEDYVVEVGGFECLHFSKVMQVLKDEDQVSIRTLQKAEIRARTLTGRLQISEGGQHLLDGIPFGRPYLRTPNRPAIHIPPRKRRRIEYGEPEQMHIEAPRGAADASGQIPLHWKMPVEDIEEDDSGEDDSEEDDDYVPKDGAASITKEHAIGANGKRGKTVRFKNPPISQELVLASQGEEDEDESEEDFMPDWEEEESSDSNEDSSASDTDETSASDELSDSSAASDSSSEVDLSESSDGSSGSESIKLDNFSDDAAVRPKSARIVRQVPPKQGKAATKARNHRRRDLRRLNKLKSIGILEPTATLDTLRNFCGVSREALQTEGGASSGAPEQSNEKEELNQRRLQLLEQLDAGGIDVTDSGSARHTKDRQAPNRKLPALEKPNEVSPDTSSSATLTNGIPIATSTDLEKAEVREKELQASKRLRLDKDGARRTIFGSLGVRAPKTKADEAKIKAKMMETGKPRRQPKGSATQTEFSVPTDPEDPNAWKSKINLTAFECWNEDVELTRPPFPFRQYWHQTSNGKNARKSKKRKSLSSHYYDDGRMTYGEEANPQLNDDDEDDAPETLPIQKGSHADIDNAVECQLQLDIEKAITKDDLNDLPSLPADLSTLPSLTRHDTKVGSIIVFKHLVCSAQTGWCPTLSPFQTAVVEDEEAGDSSLGLRLAKRDRPGRKLKYDSKGNRIYEKFEMSALTDLEEEYGDELQYLAFEELQDARLLKAAGSGALLQDGEATNATDGPAEPNGQQSNGQDVEVDGIMGDTVAPTTNSAETDEGSTEAK